MKHGNRIGKGRRFQGPIVPLAMPLMDLRVIEHRRRWVLSWKNFRDQLGVSFEQRVDRIGHLTSYPTEPAFSQQETASFRHTGSGP
jgi:hypothetical protein